MKVEPNVVISEFITNMDDLLHHEDTHNVNIPSKVAPQKKSLERFNVPYYVLTNEPNQETIDNLHIVNVDLQKIYERFPHLTLYFYRIFMAFYFLQDHPEIKKAALTDAGDVTMLNYPFDKIKPDTLYIGDETTFLFYSLLVYGDKNPWFINDFIFNNSNLLPTLNLGVMAGTRAVLIEYLGMMVKLITEAELKVQQGDESYRLGKYEMAISNYVAYKYFPDRLVHGREVTSLFGGYQKNSSAWFKHK
ncbi:hypothetical protein [Pediococcus acidilactici]|uniref:hypothetical protein n=1 Tax=Pediococcus acidilactici TaxID=1254 RepID=UPI001C6FED8D|nr:hypothetical protein [Pediococcus acidilactici]MBW9300540.1 hypothetical protein [Pediococcus acidilactici]